VKKIEIDDEVYAFLQHQAVAYEETPNTTLRRLLRLGPRTAPRSGRRPVRPTQTGRRSKADLEVLVSAELLKPAEILELRDYQGRKVEGSDAKVSGSGLLFNGRRYTMSNLAQRLLQQHGYRGTSVRGPAHWFTKSGKSIKELWEELAD
jgi:hypothetical protein